MQQINYREVYFRTSTEIAEILLAELGNHPYDTFEETEDGLKAYIEEDDFDEDIVRDLVAQYGEIGSISYMITTIPRENWNQEWEKNFRPITVGEKIRVRADFHDPDPAYPFEIIIVPKMSFGTGHHDTTAQMLHYQLSVDHDRKTVIDAGTGTGILAVMAAKKGAATVYANDIDPWCIDNSRENFALNNCTEIQVEQGTIELFQNLETDILLANINRNVLLQEIPMYAGCVKPGGTLLLSGFYEQDLPELEKALESNGFSKESHTVKNKWCAMKCTRNN